MDTREQIHPLQKTMNQLLILVLVLIMVMVLTDVWAPDGRQDGGHLMIWYREVCFSFSSGAFWFGVVLLSPALLSFPLAPTTGALWTRRSLSLSVSLIVPVSISLSLSVPVSVSVSVAPSSIPSIPSIPPTPPSILGGSRRFHFPGFPCIVRIISRHKFPGF